MLKIGQKARKVSLLSKFVRWSASKTNFHRSYTSPPLSDKENLQNPKFLLTPPAFILIECTFLYR